MIQNLHHPRLRLASLVVILACMLACWAWAVKAAPSKQPAPDPAALEEAAALVREVYGQLIAARTDQDRQASARVLIMRGDETRNAPAAKHALYDQARALAVEAGDIQTANDAIERLEMHFESDYSRERLDAVVTTARSAKTKAEHKAIATAALALANRLVAEDRFDEASSVLARTRSSAHRSKRPETLSAYKELPEQIRSIRAQASRIADDLEALQTAPDDPALNQSVGTFYALYKGDWDRGLRMLTKSAKPKLSEAAKHDLAGASQSEDQIGIGDRWWSLAANSDEETERRSYQQRARHWYAQAIQDTSGIQRSALLKRLAPQDGIKWGDLTLKPGIRTTQIIDDNPATRRRLPDQPESKWIVEKPSQPVGKRLLIEFEGYLYSPRAGEFMMETVAAWCTIDLRVNGDPAMYGSARTRRPLRLIRGYNHIKGTISVGSRHLQGVDHRIAAVIALVSEDGKSVDIPTEHWFHEAAP